MAITSTLRRDYSRRGNVARGVDTSITLRDALKRSLPARAQNFLTWMTGCAPEGELPPAFMETAWFQKAAPWWYAASKFGGVFVGWVTAAGVTYAVGTGTAPVGLCALLPVAWCLTVGSARGLQVETLHQCIHETNTGNPVADCLIAEAATGVAFCNSPARYQIDHVDVHHSTDLCSMNDPDVQFLFSVVGLEPGVPKKELHRRLLMALFSPWFHASFLRARFRGVFNRDDVMIFLKKAEGKRSTGGKTVGLVRAGALLRWTMALVLHVGLPVAALVATIMSGTVWPFLSVLLALTLPSIILYQQSALTHFCGEHYWKFRPITEDSEPFRKTMQRMTFARFYGEAPPETGGLSKVEVVTLWTSWATRMLFWHLPVRFVISAASLPWHDRHHTGPRDKKWILGPWWRAQDVADTRQVNNGTTFYTENWGLGKQIDVVLTSISELPPFTEEERTVAEQACKGGIADTTFMSM